jgi:hypothetical protein
MWCLGDREHQQRWDGCFPYICFVKRWMQWLVFIVFQLAAVIFMAERTGNWGKIAPVYEFALILMFVFCATVSISMEYKYKLYIHLD